MQRTPIWVAPVAATPVFSLNLAGWQVMSSKRMARDDLDEVSFPTTRCSHEKIVVTARYAAGPTPCACGCPKMRTKGRLSKTVLDAPFVNEPVYIEIQQERLRCPVCHASRMQELPDIAADHKMTRRCLNLIEADILTTSVDDMAARFGSSPPVIRDIFKKLIRDLNRGYLITAPAVIGIDEKTIDGQRHTVIADLTVSSRVLDVLPDQKATSLRSWLRGLENKSNVSVVAMDGCEMYRAVVRQELPDATIVLDRWHMQKLVTGKGLRAASFKTILSDWQKAWEAETCDEAAVLFDAWIASLSPEAKSAFRSFVRIYAERRDDVLAYWLTDITNGATERANRHIKRIVATIGGGYETVRARAIFAKVRPYRDRLRCSRCQGFFRQQHLGVASCSDEYVLEYACFDCVPLPPPPLPPTMDDLVARGILDNDDLSPLIA